MEIARYAETTLATVAAISAQNAKRAFEEKRQNVATAATK